MPSSFQCHREGAGEGEIETKMMNTGIWLEDSPAKTCYNNIGVFGGGGAGCRDY